MNPDDQQNSDSVNQAKFAFKVDSIISSERHATGSYRKILKSLSPNEFLFLELG